jgi:antitoxin StbD
MLIRLDWCLIWIQIRYTISHHFRFTNPMEQLFASRSISVTELKRSPTAAIEQAGEEPVAVLNHNRPAAYLVPAATYQNMLAQLQMQQWRSAIEVSRADKRPALSEEAAFSDIESAIQAVEAAKNPKAHRA